MQIIKEFYYGAITLCPYTYLNEFLISLYLSPLEDNLVPIYVYQ